ncbi:hypothetical protein CK203_061581 [Vitis vinifera]|uniref:SKP1 component POZ domain-containing protein n=1 Tax=Vitis vinifera TaxID=29760 RepID=A0A438G9C7_VITVI|nr:hypothetical protein CK203_061581 [Vitis vinifera]
MARSLVAKAVAVQSQTIKHMLEVVTDENMVIPVLEVNGKTLAKTVSYCSKRAKELNEEDEKVVIDLREWDENVRGLGSSNSI